ncbi:MAG: hypothetical protein JW722_03225 [Demequinaceae bacterium]|nr:hypothetical protein [Demequinaceae bacterium]
MIRPVTGILALGAALAIAAFFDPLPEEPVVRTPTTMDVVPTDLPIGCWGWMVLPVGEAGEGDGGLAPGASDVLRTMIVSDEREIDPVGFGFMSDAVIGVQVERVGHGDLSGLAAATCSRPAKDAWLVGGSTRLGSSARLVLVNPSDVTTEVVATVYGPTGQVDQTIIVSMGAETSESILIEGVAAELATLVVHVEADGAGVVAAIQDSRLNGFLPAGSEWVVAGAAPSTRLVIPAVGPGDPEGIDGSATIRLMAPEGATASLTLISDAGVQPWPGVRNMRLEAGIPIDIDVPASLRSVVIVEADQPVVAAAITRKGRVPDEGLEGDIARDITWVAGQDPRIGSLLTATMPPYTVTVVAYADAQTVFRVRDADTGTLYAEALMGAGTMAEIPLDADPGTLLAIEGEASWVLIIEDLDFRTAVQPVDTRDNPVSISAIPGFYVP